MSDHFWGIDLGGTKIEGVVLPTATSSEPLSRLRLPTERDRGYEHVRRQIVHLVDQLADAVGERPTRLGIGTPGVLDPKTRQLKKYFDASYAYVSALKPKPTKKAKKTASAR